MNRTEIAAMAMQAMVSHNFTSERLIPEDLQDVASDKRYAFTNTTMWDGSGDLADLASRSFRIADAMLAEAAKSAKPDTGEALLSSVLAKACQSLLDIIHDDMTHAEQRHHACAIQDAQAALDAARKAGAK